MFLLSFSATNCNLQRYSPNKISPGVWTGLASRCWLLVVVGRCCCWSLLDVIPNQKISYSHPCWYNFWAVPPYILFGYAVWKLSILHDYIQKDEVGSLGPKWDPSNSNSFWAQGRFFPQDRFGQHERVSKFRVLKLLESCLRRKSAKPWMHAAVETVATNVGFASQSPQKNRKTYNSSQS